MQVRRGEEKLGRSEHQGCLLSLPSTHNSIRRRGTPNEALHLATVTSHCKLHCLAGDNRGSYKQEDTVRPDRGCSAGPGVSPTQGTHHLRKVVPLAQPLRFEAQWPDRYRCQHLPGSLTSATADCCYSGPGQRDYPRMGSQEARTPRLVRAPYQRHGKESTKGHK